MSNEEVRNKKQEEKGGETSPPTVAVDVLPQASRDTEIETLKRQCDEYLAGWKRAQADYANLVKETERAKREFAVFGVEQALLKILPAIDQMELAMQFAPVLDKLLARDRQAVETWLTGLEAVRTLWEQSAKDLGLERVSATGQLDPSIHEAVAEEASVTVPAGEIVKATQSGWRLSGKLIRPAKVIISKGALIKN